MHNFILMDTNLAFPTLSKSVHLPKKSIFDNEDNIKLITLNVSYSFYPLYRKQNKARSGFVLINNSTLEIYKSQKHFKNNKSYKHMIKLEEVFNICIQKELIQLRGDCLCIMDFTETYFIKPINSEYTINDWYEYVLEKCRVLRSAKLIRTVFREEYFEAAWDLILVKKPKLKRDYSKHIKIDDLVKKHPNLEGRRRLCIHPGAILIFQLNATPTANVGNPFNKFIFVNFPLNVISSYGHQEKYFILRAGRFSEIGSGELWCFCGSGAGAKSVHDRIIEVVTKEAERRQAQGETRQNWPSTTTTRKKREKRKNHKKQTKSETDNSNLSATVDPKTGCQTEINKSIALLPRKCFNSYLIALNSIKSECKKTTELSKQQKTNLKKLTDLTQLKNIQTKKFSFVNFFFTCLKKKTISTFEELHLPYSINTPSNLTLLDKIYDSENKTNVSISASMLRFVSTSTTAHLNTGFLNYGLNNNDCSEDYVLYDVNKSYSINEFDKTEKKISSNVELHDQTSMEKEYLEMDMEEKNSINGLSKCKNQCCKKSCSKMMLVQNSKKQLPIFSKSDLHSDEKSNASLLSDATTESDNIETTNNNFAELRKRAHSLGSKSWIKPSLRKILVKNSSNFLTKNVKNLSTNDQNKDFLEKFTKARTRADSASGIVNCFNNNNLKIFNERQSNLLYYNSNAFNYSVKNNNPDLNDHVEIDFDRDGSCPSIESPLNRSRNASFGVQISNSIRSALDLALTSNYLFSNNKSNINNDLLTQKNIIKTDNNNDDNTKNDVYDVCQNSLSTLNKNCNSSFLFQSNEKGKKKQINKNNQEDCENYVLMEYNGAQKTLSNFITKTKFSDATALSLSNCSRVISTIIESNHSSSSDLTESEQVEQALKAILSKISNQSSLFVKEKNFSNNFVNTN